MTERTVLITGGAGFIGSALVRAWRTQRAEDRIVVLDALTHAGHRENLAPMSERGELDLVQADIRDRGAVTDAFSEVRPQTVVHLAAESHVDRSIDGPADCITTNVTGTLNLLEAFRTRWRDAGEPGSMRFHHVSTDEVYGSLAADAPAFTEDSPYAPNSPYAASKAAADHLVRAWHRTYGLPVTLSNGSNNLGPRQHPEKLIPTVIQHALAGQPIPVYGDGLQRRDWIWVDDHCDALLRIVEDGVVGRTYNVGAGQELDNLSLVGRICQVLDRERPRASGSHADAIEHVTDRPGHDRRYAIDASRIRRELAWAPSLELDDALAQTVTWYLENGDWLRAVGGSDPSPRQGLER